MDENFEEPVPTGNTGTASSKPIGLDKALNLPETGGTNRNSSSAGSMANPMTKRAEGMIPQGSLLKIPVNVQVILGTTRMPLSKVMALGPGSVVVLDKELSEPVVLMINGNEVARGLIVVVNESTGQLGISLTEVSSGGSDENSPNPMQ